MKYIYKPEENVNFTTFYSSSMLFTVEECEKIKKIGKAIKKQKATTFGGDSPVRKGKVSWIPQEESTDFIYSRIFSLVEEANQNWNFDLIGLLEDCQYTSY